jgi:hypothetical protein
MSSYGITNTGTLGAKSIEASGDALYKVKGTILSGEGELTAGTVLSYAYDGTKYVKFGAAAVTGIAVTFTIATDLVGKTAHGYSDDMKIYFSSVTTTTGVATNAIYYIKNVTADTFQIALTPGGVPIDLATGNGTGVMVIPADTDTDNIKAILVEDIDATSADVEANIYVHGKFILDNLTATTTLAVGAYSNGNLIFIDEA